MKPTLVDTDILSLFFRGHPAVVARFAEYAEEKWHNVYDRFVKKELGLSYAGPKAGNVMVEPDLPKAARSKKSESTELTEKPESTETTN